jgi:EAL domain-containing protein (putative c-di-GMP-specific phosphodiesterase class I)/FixJ family two-component response regulator
MTDVPRIRVLIAEDDDSVRSALSALIEDEPALEVVAAVGDAAEAVEAARTLQPDVALLDVRMPGGGGAEAARGIKLVAPETRMLALSAHGDRETVFAMVEAGVMGYLVKGSPVASIVGSIERAAEGLGSLSSEVATDVIHELAGQLTTQRRADERRQGIDTRIRACLYRANSFGMVFQPICTLDGILVGSEALSRFRGPPRRSPDRWFAEAEEVGLRTELELAAVRAAIGHLDTIPPESYLSVNASPATVESDEFHRLVRDAGGTRIVVEVTEHAQIANYARMTAAVAALRQEGVRLAIDDAGAGFASLRHILRLDPDFIKLDRTLIQGMASDRSKQALAAGLISFAEKIGATIIAEGIETRAELRALRALGVPYGQGFYLARPVRAARLGTVRVRQTTLVT